MGTEEQFQGINFTPAKDKIYHPVTRSCLFPLLDLHASICVTTVQSYFTYIRNNILHCKKANVMVN